MSELSDGVAEGISKNRTLTFSVIGLLCFVVLLCIIIACNHFYRCYEGESSKLFWGMHECIGQQKIISPVLTSTTEPVHKIQQDPDTNGYVTETVVKTPITPKRNNKRKVDNTIPSAAQTPLQPQPINAKNVNTGTNNGVVGDVNISQNQLFTDRDKIEMDQAILRLEKQYNFYAIKYVDVDLADPSKGSYMNNVIEYLKTKGISLNGTGTLQTYPPIQGRIAEINKKDSSLHLTFGFGSY